MPNVERVKLLIDALRSGHYDKTKYYLRTLQPNGKPCYCVTGLACEIYRQHTKCGEWTGVHFHLKGPYGFMPPKVQKWFGFEDPCVNIEHLGKSLMTLNDWGASFTELADILESELKGYHND